MLPREARRLGNGHTGEAHGTLSRIRPLRRENEAMARVQLLGPRAGGGEDIGGAGSEVAGGDAGVLMVYNKMINCPDAHVHGAHMQLIAGETRHRGI